VPVIPLKGTAFHVSPSALPFILSRWFLDCLKTVREGSVYTIIYQMYLGVRLPYTLKNLFSVSLSIFACSLSVTFLRVDLR